MYNYIRHIPIFLFWAKQYNLEIINITGEGKGIP